MRTKEHPDVYRELVYGGALCNNASLDPDHKGEIIGDPTEGALIFLAQKFGIDHEELEETYPRLFEQPFDSERKRMSTVHEINQKLVSYTKGAVDEMLPLCTGMLTSRVCVRLRRPISGRFRICVIPCHKKPCECWDLP